MKVQISIKQRNSEFDLDYANEYKFEHEFNDGYFLTDPNWFVKNHFPLDSKWLLTASETQFSAFKKMPIMYNEAFKYRLFPIFFTGLTCVSNNFISSQSRFNWGHT